MSTPRDRGARSAWSWMPLGALLLASAGCSLGFDDEYPIYRGDGGTRGGGEDASATDGGSEAGAELDAAPAGDAGDASASDGGGSADAGCADGSIADGGTCATDPCAESPCGEHGACAPADDAPGYTCTCDAGYERDGDACVDIDECFEGTFACHLSATCTNTPGSYDCACALGEVGGGRDGVACTPRIVAGTSHVCVVLVNGRVQCWGSNTGGALGDGTEIDRPAPVMVVALEDVLGVSAYGNGNCAVVAGGEVRCWGNDQLEVQTVPELADVIAVSTCFGHSCAVQQDGAVQCWGQNTEGQLGNGEMSDTPAAAPMPVAGLGGAAIGVHVVSTQSCVVLQSGAVQCWGSGYLGNEDGASSLVPVNAAVTNAIAVASGGFHWCALRGNRRVHCWGNTALFGGSSGITSEPIVLGALSNVATIDVEVYRTHALLVDGTIEWWDAGVENMKVPDVDDAVAVASGGRIGCALHEDGTVSCWDWVNGGDIPMPMPVAGVDLW